jgi:glycine cleavage system H protein
VSDLYCPISGEVVAINEALADDPAVINSDPYGAGWMIKLRSTEPDELGALLDAAAYGTHVEG